MKGAPYSICSVLCPGQSCELAENRLPLSTIGWAGVSHCNLCNERTVFYREEIAHLRRRVVRIEFVGFW